MSRGSRHTSRVGAALCGLLLVASVADAAEPPARPSTTEINKQVSNPVTTTWSLKFENEILWLDSDGDGERAQYQLKFQPTLPVVLTRQWKLITRPEFVLVDDKPYTNSQGAARRTTGVGDTTLDLALAPIWEHWLLGLGPTFIFPSANLDETGQGKWQAGPAAVAGYQAQRWLAYVIAQQWWSFAGAADRQAVSQLHLQYVANWFFPHGWSVGTSPTIKFDWRADAGQQVTFPLGLQVSRVLRLGDHLPVKFLVQGLYMPIHPDAYGEHFGLQIEVTPVIPSLLPQPLFGDP